MNIELKNEILANANLPESWWDDCFITEDKMIFTPRFDKDGEMIATGEEKGVASWNFTEGRVGRAGWACTV